MIEDVVELAKNQIAKEKREALEAKRLKVQERAVAYLKDIERYQEEIAHKTKMIVTLNERLDAIRADPMAFYDAHLAPASEAGVCWIDGDGVAFIAPRRKKR